MSQETNTGAVYAAPQINPVPALIGTTNHQNLLTTGRQTSTLLRTAARDTGISTRSVKPLPKITTQLNAAAPMIQHFERNLTTAQNQVSSRTPTLEQSKFAFIQAAQSLPEITLGSPKIYQHVQKLTTCSPKAFKTEVANFKTLVQQHQIKVARTCFTTASINACRHSGFSAIKQQTRDNTTRLVAMDDQNRAFVVEVAPNQQGVFSIQAETINIPYPACEKVMTAFHTNLRKQGLVFSPKTTKTHVDQPVSNLGQAVKKEISTTTKKTKKRQRKRTNNTIPPQQKIRL